MMATNTGRTGLPNNYNYGRTARQLRHDEAMGEVMHSDARTTGTGTSSAKGLDAGMSASLGRAKTTSDYQHPTPEDHAVAPGQRTTRIFGAGRLIDQNQYRYIDGTDS